ncbi:LuxR C-terminal-related transcriptional regulator [Longispora sp. K20-0274]|uniref:LuxR C-terminal-related transcriptional regulator n=1 Tax=Longispora sp. K20-0274 TaxID=3088255 RepID=UPI00399A504D
MEGLITLGLTELAAGSARQAVAYFDDAVAAGEKADDLGGVALALAGRGRAHLPLGGVAAAVRDFERARVLVARLGVPEPDGTTIDVDFAEALALNGEPDRARHILADTRCRAEREDRPGVLLGVARVEALVAAVTGDPRGAADGLRAALPAEHRHPVELARAWGTLGDLETRARRPGRARAAWAEAARRFEAAGCPSWLEYANQRLARLGTGERATSDTERHILDLVLGGSSNREIAVRLHLSVKAVEANLTRLYRRTNTRNRSELAHRVRLHRQGG